MMLKSQAPPEIVPFTKVPKSFFKSVLPNLSGAEVMVLLVLIDKTCGFHKEEDAISISQFAKASGLAHSTVSVALEKLIEKKYICVRAGKKYKGQEKIYTYTPPEDKPLLRSVVGGRKTNNQLIEEML